MAVDGYTVDDFIRQVNLKLRADHAGSIEDLDKIAALEEAKSQVWRLLVASDNGWFVVPSQNSPSADDHFPDITQAAGRIYDLPPAFHQMYYVDVTTASKQDFKFIAIQMRDSTYRKKRRTTSAAAASSDEREYYYDIIGANPAKLVLAEGLPTSVVLAVTIFFVRILDRWTALADSVDDMILPFMPVVVTRAAQILAAGVGDKEMASDLRAEWQEQRAEILAITPRLLSDPAGLLDSASGKRPQKVTGSGRL